MVQVNMSSENWYCTILHHGYCACFLLMILYYGNSMLQISLYVLGLLWIYCNEVLNVVQKNSVLPPGRHKLNGRNKH